jgi:hypothetical protein
LKSLARILLIVLGLLLLAHYLPQGYWLLMAKRWPRAPIVFYSCVTKDFLFMRYTNGVMTRMDRHGKTYSRAEFETMLPLDNWAQLARDGRMPKSINGVEVTPGKIRYERMSLRIRPDMLDTPEVPLHPLLESESQRVRLEMPGDFMRLEQGIEFVNAATNLVEKEKSARYAKAFADARFAFPPARVAGNPNILKPYDEGYFLVDATGATFHLRQVRGEPVLRRISEVVPPAAKAQWESLKPRFMHVQEQECREIRAFLLDQNNRPWLVVGEQYRLVPLPLEHYNPATVSVAVRGDLFNRLITATAEDNFELLAFDRDYAVVRSYNESLPTRNESAVGAAARVLFPFTLEFDDDASGFVGFYLRPGSPATLLVSAACLLGVLGWLAARKRLCWRQLPDILAVAVGGIYGVLLFLLLPRTE